MHWIKTIRENLRLTQNEVAGYLYLSVRTIQSIEQCRRALPFKSMEAAIRLYNAMKAGKKRPLNDLPPESDLRTQRKLKGLYRRCCHSLVLCREKLQKMQADYENACQSLSAYQLLAQDLATTNTPDDLARVKWTEWRIAEARHRITENNTTAQGLLSVEIAALEARAQGLEKMLVTDIMREKNQPHAVNPRDAADQRNTPDEDQRPREETGVHEGTRTTSPRCYQLHEHLKGVEPEPTKPRLKGGDGINGKVKRLDHTDANPHPGGGSIVAPDTGFMKGFSSEEHDGFTNICSSIGQGITTIVKDATKARLRFYPPIHNRVPVLRNRFAGTSLQGKENLLIRDDHNNKNAADTFLFLLSIQSKKSVHPLS